MKLVALILALSLCAGPRAIDPDTPTAVAAPDDAAEVEVAAPDAPSKPEAEPEAEPEPAAPSPQRAVPPPQPKPPPAKTTRSTKCFAARERCYRLTATGIALASIGFAAVATGIGFIATPQRVDSDDPRFITSYRPPGAVLAGLGSGVLLIGVMMIVASRGAYRRGSIARRLAGGRF